jgi:hypothetical protein
MARIKKAQKGVKEPKYSNINLLSWTDKPTSKDSADYRAGYFKGVSDVKKGLPKSKTQYDPQFGMTQKRLGYAEAYEEQKPKKQKNGGKTPAWTRSEGKDPKGGLNRKGVASYRAANPGSKLKTAVTTKPSKLKPGSKAANRRKSFCARMSGMKKRLTSAKTANDPNSRINKSLRKWNC